MRNVNKHQNREWLVDRYLNEKMGAYEIAKLAGCSHTTIYKWLRRHGIERRSNSEASKLTWAQGVYDGENHPQWNGGKWIQCFNCGESIYRGPKRLQETQTHFCSRECQHIYTRGERHPSWKAKIKVHCATCGKALEISEWQSDHARFFCSRTCQDQGHSGPNHPSWKGGDWVECDNCGELVFKKAHRLGRQELQFCSRECKDGYFQGENHQLWSQVELTCRQCGRRYSLCPSHAATSKYCSVKCYHLSMEGENGPQWRGGLSFEPYPPTFNKRFKRMIRTRDGYTCGICRLPGKAVHHINYVKEDTNPANCITLCRSCHATTNHHRGYWQPALTQIMVARGHLELTYDA